MSCKVNFYVVRSALQNSAFADVLLIWLIRGSAAGQGKVFVHPSLNRVYIKIKEAVVRFRGLLVN